MTGKEQAGVLHQQGYNCAQAVLASMENYTGIPERTALSVASGFGRGVRCGEICGAVSGAVMAAGLHYGAENRAKTEAFDHALVSAFYEQFGAVRCADLKAKQCSCDELIAFAAEKTEELLSTEDCQMEGR